MGERNWDLFPGLLSNARLSRRTEHAIDTRRHEAAGRGAAAADVSGCGPVPLAGRRSLPGVPPRSGCPDDLGRLSDPLWPSM